MRVMGTQRGLLAVAPCVKLNGLSTHPIFPLRFAALRPLPGKLLDNDQKPGMVTGLA